MQSRQVLITLVSLCVLHLAKSDPPLVQRQQNVKVQQEQKLSDYIITILEHYKQKDPVGLPGAPIPDPLDVPALRHSFSFGTMKMFDMKLYGLKKFKIDHVKANIAAMKVEAALIIDKLHIIGNYTLSTWFSKAEGPFTVDLSHIYVKAIATLEVDRNGQLEAQDMIMDMSFKDIAMDFKNLGGFASFLQGVMNSVGTFVFDSVKPFVLKEVSATMRGDINKEVRKFPQKFPNSISPFDQLISELRKKVRERHFDPYRVNDYNTSVGVLDVYMSHTWIYGLSSFYRTKDIIFEIRNNTVHALIEVGTQRLLGTSHWTMNLVAGMMTRSDTIKFSVEYINVGVSLSQTLDTRNPPNLDDIQIELGNIQIRFNGLGTADYIIEAAVNILPNLLRYQIMDALEGPIKLRIQDALHKVNIENLIKENKDKIDNNQGFDDLF